MTRSARWAAAVVIALGSIAVGCSAESDPVRIAVLADCNGVFGFAYESSVAGAELPLLSRGGRLAGAVPSAGVTGARVAGRPVELDVVCLSGLPKEDTLAARRAVEIRGADIVVGPTFGTSGFVYRSYAKRQPGVTFVSGTAATQATTLRDPAPNLFRFTTEGTQWSAGLGTYAYRDLGWRRAAVVTEDYSFSWDQAGGFIAEFCSLGGSVVRESSRLGTADLSPIVDRLSAERFDGVYLASNSGWLITLANELPQLQGPLGDKLIGGVIPLQDPGVFSALGKRLEGVVWAPGAVSTAPSTPAWSRYGSRFAAAFPALPPGSGLYSVPIAYYDAMDAVVQALEQVDGDLSDGQRRFRAALAMVSLDAPSGKIRLDANRQAIGPNYLAHVERDAKGNLSSVPFRTIPDVDQGFGGLITGADPPHGSTSPACKTGNPPPWAR